VAGDVIEPILGVALLEELVSRVVDQHGVDHVRKDSSQRPPEPLA
jgi:hypothetical protein